MLRGLSEISVIIRHLSPDLSYSATCQKLGVVWSAYHS
jgi:hypothetical protein